MWQQDGDSWTEVSCDDDLLGVIADAVVFRRSSIKVPFGLESLPDGYGLSSVTSDENQGMHAVYLGVVNPAFGLPDSDVVISYETGSDPLHRPSGRSITVNGRPAFLDEEPESPGVCVLEQQRHICVSAYLSDTGPNPNRPVRFRR